MGAAAPGKVAGTTMPPDTDGEPRPRLRRWVGAAAVIVAVGAVAVATTDPFAATHGSPTLATNPYSTSTAPVMRQSLTSQILVSATVGAAGSYSVVNQAQGTLTWLPSAGRVVRQGRTLYRVSGSPVMLLYGSVPAYRTLSAGLTGQDVAELNHDLVALGYAASADVAPLGWHYFSWETGYALEKLQEHLGLTPTGTLPLGQAVFLPTAVQVTGPATGVVPGGSAQTGAIVLTATSTSPVVTIALDTAEQTYVKDGNRVSIALPDGATTPGVISSVGHVAAAATSGSGGSGSSATITVLVTPTDPAAVAGLTSAPVTVTITTANVSNVLVVPVDALLAQPGGGYAVEVTAPGRHHLVPVSTGLFDDADGLVQVTGAGLAAGQRVVVPGS